MIIFGVYDFRFTYSCTMMCSPVGWAVTSGLKWGSGSMLDGPITMVFLLYTRMAVDIEGYPTGSRGPPSLQSMKVSSLETHWIVIFFWILMRCIFGMSENQLGYLASYMLKSFRQDCPLDILSPCNFEEAFMTVCTFSYINLSIHDKLASLSASYMTCMKLTSYIKPFI